MFLKKIVTELKLKFRLLLTTIPMDKKVVLLCIITVITGGLTLELNYHSMEIGDLCVSISWSFDGTECRPTIFKLQGFEPEIIRESHLTQPSLSINFTSANFLIIKSYASHKILYYDFIGLDTSEMICHTSPYLNFSSLLETGFHFICSIPFSTQLCFQISEETFALRPFFLWPKSSQNSDGYCICSPYYPNHFTACAESCGSLYKFSVSGRELCLNTSGIGGNETIKAYLTLEDDVCQNVECLVTTLIASYWISIQSPCMEQSQNSYSQYEFESDSNSDNFTISLNETLQINTLLNTNKSILQLVWTHNGNFIDINEAGRVTVARNGSLTLSHVQPSDAGYYAMITSYATRCESISFKVAVQYIFLWTSLEARANILNFNVTAVGYPNVQLLMWRTGNNAIVSESLYNISIVTTEFNFTVTSTLSVGRHECMEARGYLAVFTADHNGSAITKSQVVHCPEGPPNKPEIFYNMSSKIVCLNAYAHPNFPVEYYALEIITSHAVIYEWLNHTNCYIVSTEVDRHVCVQINISAIAHNVLGNSSVNNLIIQENELCDDLLRSSSTLFQVVLIGVRKCMEWKEANTPQKAMKVASQLHQSIKNQCDCNFPIENIYRPWFECLHSHSNSVVFRAHVIEYVNLTLDSIAGLLHNFIQYQNSVSVEGDLLYIAKDCFLDMHSYECDLTMSFTKSTITTVSAALLVFLVVVSTTIISFTVYAKKRKRKTPNTAIETPVYEEVSAVKKETEERSRNSPVYEQICSSALNNRNVVAALTVCEAYGANDDFISVKQCPAYGL